MPITRICVFAGSSPGARPEYAAAAAELGSTLASRGVGLVYGGASVGLMGALADATLGAGGRVIGVMPEALVAKEVGHTKLSEFHVVGSMHERKAMMVDRSDAFIALPGGLGTLEELFEVLTWGQLGLHRKPVGLLNVRAFFDPLLAHLNHAVEERLIKPEHRAMVRAAADVGGLLEEIATYEPPSVAKWINRQST